MNFSKFLIEYHAEHALKSAEFKRHIDFVKINDSRFKVEKFKKQQEDGKVFQYTINPETRSWQFSVADDSDSRFIDEDGGEDDSSLIKHLKKHS